MANQPCLQAGCSAYATYRGRCGYHAKVHDRTTHPNKKLYGKAKWQRTRRRILFKNPLCPCGAIATDVDHITPIEKGGKLWAPANLQALCAKHHSQKTRREQVA